jgi:hypothetical protein
MAVIHTEKKQLKLAVPLLAVTLVVAGVGVWWFQQINTPTSVTPLTAASAPAIDTATVASSAMQDVPAPQVVEQLIDQQKASAQKIAQDIEAAPQIKPVKGNVSEKPSFMSDMEWGILQAVSQQQADPDKALTALVNKLRFTKQLEVWQDLPSSTDPSKRKLLANELLEDLPQRLSHEDMDLAGAQKLQSQLLQDAETDEKARAKRAAKEAKRLEKALPPQGTAG